MYHSSQLHKCIIHEQLHAVISFFFLRNTAEKRMINKKLRLSALHERLAGQETNAITCCHF